MPEAKEQEERSHKDKSLETLQKPAGKIPFGKYSYEFIFAVWKQKHLKLWENKMLYFFFFIITLIFHYSSKKLMVVYMFLPLPILASQ